MYYFDQYCIKMNIKNKLILLFILSSVLTLSIITIKNTEKTKFYLFTFKTEEISIGNLITITFVSGFTFSSLLTSLISKNNLQESLEDNNELLNEPDENIFSQKFDVDRPPERDIRESQPTISVNYRFVDNDNNTYTPKNTKKNLDNIDNNDWSNTDNEW